MSLASICRDYDWLLDYLMNEILPKRGKLNNSDTTIISLFVSLEEKAKSIDLLMNNQQYSEIQAITRSFLEQTCYLQFIFEKNTINRSRALFYYSRFQSVNKSKRALDGFSNQELAKKWKKEADARIRQSSNGRESLQEEYEYFSNKYHSIFPEGTKNRLMRNWYDFESPGTITSFRALVDYLDQNDLYIGMYAIYSDSVHGSDAPKILRLSDYNKATKVGIVSIMFEVPAGDVRMIEGEMNLLFTKICTYYKILKHRKVKSILEKIMINTKLRQTSR